MPPVDVLVNAGFAVAAAAPNENPLPPVAVVEAAGPAVENKPPKSSYEFK